MLEEENDKSTLAAALENLISEADKVHGMIMGKEHGYLKDEEGVEEAMEAQEPTETPEMEALETPEEQEVEEEEGIEEHAQPEEDPKEKLKKIFGK